MTERGNGAEQQQPELTEEELAIIKFLKSRLDASEDSADYVATLRVMLNNLGVPSGAIAFARLARKFDNEAETEQKEKTALERLDRLFPGAESDELTTIHRLAVDPEDTKTDQLMATLHKLVGRSVDTPKGKERLAESFVRLRLAIEGYSSPQIAEFRNVTKTAVTQSMGRMENMLTGVYRMRVHQILNEIYGFSIDTSDMAEPLSPRDVTYGRNEVRMKRRYGQRAVTQVVSVTPVETTVDVQSAATIGREGAEEPEAPSRFWPESRGDTWDEKARDTAEKFARSIDLSDDDVLALTAFLSPTENTDIPHDQQQAAAVRIRESMKSIGFDRDVYQFSIEETHFARRVLGIPPPASKQQEFGEPQTVASIIADFASKSGSNVKPGFVEGSTYSMLDKVHAEIRRAQHKQQML